MTLTTVSVLAEGEKKDNFLIPNGTFLVELVIFLIVLAVIWKFVVPPIQSVLQAREAQAVKTNEDNQKAAEALRNAQRKYSEELSGARTEATSIRDQARAEGQKALGEARAAAQAEADQAQAQVDGELRAQADRISAELKGSVGPLSEELAGKVLNNGAGVSIADGLEHDLAGRS
ncbi:MAG: F0F1 ATP synthase subunit B [Segniliparus sp.]|uniref:F0F1 ATP synthase subunit B n=1 Tax=Segniliparus sp. TaxID=2804064 RepID=UPI003F3DB34F